MADPTLFVVGVPGMGNSDPSWHQRRPYGFSKSGYSTVQARSHAYRRPSTASARLPSAAAAKHHGPTPPKALAANRSEYWGNQSNNSGKISKDGRTSRGGFSHHQQHASTRPWAGRRLRERERRFCTGCRPASSPPTRSSGTYTATAVETCTRNPAGIVRGGGRNGRSAPPPTPPSPLPHSSSSFLGTTPPAPPQHQQGQKTADDDACFPRSSNPGVPSKDMPRRRPSTAGAMRKPDANNGDTGIGQKYPCGCEKTRHVPAGYPPPDASQASGISCSIKGGGSGNGNYGNSIPACVEDHGTGGQAQRPSTAPRSRSPTAAAIIPPNHAALSKSNQSNNYRGSIRGETRTTCSVIGQRRRPASAAPTRSRTSNAYDEGLEGGMSDRGNVLDARRSVNTTRGRAYNRNGGLGAQRPRSASASIGRRAHIYGIDDAEQRGANRRSYGPLPMGSAGEVRSSVDGNGHSDRLVHDRQDIAARAPAVVPSFVVSEKQVLRFYGHLTEELDWGGTKSAMESLHSGPSSPTLNIRQVVLHLYLADGSLDIFEKRQANSGQQGGILLQRNIFKKRDGSMYGVWDLKVGCNLWLLGRSYRLTDCDDYTRKWYQSNGSPQAEAQEAPKETHQHLRVEHTTGLCSKPRHLHAATSSGLTPPSGRSALGSSSFRKAHQQKVNRFFRHNKETLRFNAVWDDPSYGGSRRRYDLLLFLEDETVSLLNPREERRNSGSDENMVHVRRQRLPKNWRTRSDAWSGGEIQTGGVGGDGGGHNFGRDDGGNGFVGELDLGVGRVLNVWGRDMKLVGCDPFTKAYYRRVHGIDMELKLNEAAVEKSWDSARGRRTCHLARGGTTTTGDKARESMVAAGTDHLTASLGQYMGGGTAGALPLDRYKGRRLRCKGILRSNMPNDKGREFVVTYDLALDTLMVYELQRRNSGRPGGLFLVKGKHRHPGKNGRYYVPQDLFLGAELPLITGHTLVITNMDRSSLALCEENPQEFPLMDSDRVLRRIAQRAMNKRLALRSELHRRAASGPSSSNPSKGGSGSPGSGNAIPPSPFPVASAAPSSTLSSWTAGKVLTNGNGKWDANDRRQEHRFGRNAIAMAEAPQLESVAAEGSRVNCGNGYAQKNTTLGVTGGQNDEAGITVGRRARSGATWGLVGGWGDQYARESTQPDNGHTPNNTTTNNFDNGIDSRGVLLVESSHPTAKYGLGCRYRREGGAGNPKNESSTAPWAAVRPAGISVFNSDSGQAMLSTTAVGTGEGPGAAGASGTKKNGRSDLPPGVFQDHAAFRDALDDLDLLVGLGQQEVLTLVRAFADKTGKGISWARMCDRMSQIGTVAPAKTTRGEKVPGVRDTVGGVRIPGETPFLSLEPPAADDLNDTLLVRMRRAGVAWRSVFSRVREDSMKGSSCFLGVASLVQAMRRHGLAVGADDAAFLMRRFARGGGSMVDFNALCDKVYPCDFSPPSAPSGRSPVPSPRTTGGNHHGASSSSRGLRHTPNTAEDSAHPDVIDDDPPHFSSPQSGRVRSGGGRDRYPGEPGVRKHCGARAPRCDFDLGGEGGRVGGGDHGNFEDWGQGCSEGGEGTYSSLDREPDCPKEPQDQRYLLHSACCRYNDDCDVRSFGGTGDEEEGEVGSSRCWEDEISHV